MTAKSLTLTDPFGHQLAASRSTNCPLPWLQHRRDNGRAVWERLGLPTPSLEAWKYTNLRPLQRLDLAAATTSGAVTVPNSLLPKDMAGPRIVLVDGRLCPDFCSLANMPAGVRVVGLSTLLAETPALLEAHLGQRDDPEDALAGLNLALMEDGAVVMIDDGVVLKAAIEIVLIGTSQPQPRAWHPRLLVLVGAGASASIVEHHMGCQPPAASGSYLTNVVAEVSVGQDAELHHYKVQREAPGAWHLARTFVRIAAGGHYDNFALALGAHLCRNEVNAQIDGPNVMCRLNGAYVISGHQIADTTTFIDHAKPGSASREVYKGVIGGTGRAVFQGRILVRRDAQKTDGYQLNNALLLSDTAEIDSKPELEIYADDVKCSHGATVGDLDQEALFYMRSRGVPAAEARRLLITGFLGEAVDEIQEPDLQPLFRSLIEDALGSVEAAA